MLWVNLGYKLDKTDITPKAPKESVGIIWSSFPEYIVISSLQSCAILATCEIFPLASFIATILGILERARQVSGSMLTPVRLGTLYNTIGRSTLLAILE